MSLIINGQEIDSRETCASLCANCGSLSSKVSKDLRLCEACLDERRRCEDTLKIKVRGQFGLKRSPELRSCFLKLLLSRAVSLEPSGWRTGLALGSEMMAAGFGANDARRVLVQAGGENERAGRLIEKVREGGEGGKAVAWSCEHLRGLEVICSGCTRQFKAEVKRSITEMHYCSSSPARKAKPGNAVESRTIL